MGENCYTCKFFEKISHRGQKYPKGKCKKHFAYRISDGYQMFLHITSVDEYICDLYEPAPIPTYVLVDNELYLAPAIVVDDLIAQGWVKVQLTEEGKAVIKKVDDEQ